MGDENKDGEKLKENIISTCRSLALTLSIWLVGWFGFHWSWVFGSFFLCVYCSKKSRLRDSMKAFKSVIQDEKAALLQYKDLPSWVCFPDVERAEWLNQIVQQMWPFISTIVSDVLKESVEPEMKKHLPTLLKGFHFIEVDLGNQPLRIGGIKVYTGHVKPTEIIMDAEIIYAGDAIVKVGFGSGIKGGISHLQIRGTLRVELNPLLSKPPLIGAVTVYFLEMPEFDFDLTHLLNLLDIPGLNLIFKSVLEKVLETFIVLPHRVLIPIGDEKDLQVLKYPMPMGVLHVKIIEANGLKATDKKLFKKNSSDPFVKVKVGKFKYETKVIHNTVTPKWKDESFMLFVDRVVGHKIRFDVEDKDDVNHDSLGYAEENLEGLAHTDKTDYVLDLQEGTGTLHCKLEWLTFTDDPSEIKLEKKGEADSKMCLFVKLEHALGLPDVKMDSGTCSPHVEMKVGSKIVHSKTKRNTKRPVWDEIHYFFVDNPKDEVILLKVCESNMDEPIGTAEFKIATLLTEPGMKTSQSFPLKDCFTDGILAATLELKGLVSNPISE